MTFKCQFCKEVEVPEDNMICDACAEKEIKLQERDEQYADWHNEQLRLRYQHVQVFDNEVGKVSVTYRKKVLCTWRYFSEDKLNFFDTTTQRDAMMMAKGYIEGWLDAIAAATRPRQD